MTPIVWRMSSRPGGPRRSPAAASAPNNPKIAPLAPMVTLVGVEIRHQQPAGEHRKEVDERHAAGTEDELRET